jgi:hypothetical protein
LNTPLKLTSQNASAGIAVAMPLPALGVGTIDAYLAHQPPAHAYCCPRIYTGAGVSAY